MKIGIQKIVIRKYRPEDCAEMAELFYNTVHTINAKDYSKEQLDVWASGKIDLKEWDRSFQEHYSVVVTENGTIIGFGDIDDTGYLDRLYVHKNYQRVGIGTTICNELECSVYAESITTHASITSKAFFENRGYQVVKKQQVERQGIYLTNFVMMKKRKKT